MTSVFQEIASYLLTSFRVHSGLEFLEEVAVLLGGNAAEHPVGERSNNNELLKQNGDK